jgi:nitrogen fixation/metabolism regulation signal transduction histidine kinase
MAKPSFSRKSFFIDRRIQGRYMITFLIPMLVMLVFMLLTLYLASQTIISTSSKIMKREIENVIATETQDQAEPTAERYAKALELIRAKVRDFGSIGDIKREFAGTLLGVFGAGILLVVLQIVMMTVFFSHKLAGPVYRFEKACRSVINGHYNDVITLRKGDQMLELSLLLNEAIKASGQRIADLEARVAELNKANLEARVDKLISGDDA